MSAFNTATRASNLLAMALSAGIISIGLSGITSGPAIAAASPLNLDNSAHPTKLIKAATGLDNGVYLYGQSTQPNEIGQAYFVFEVRQGKVLGALYMPQSSFDCAYGGFQRDQLALNIVDSYEKVVYPFAIALDRSSQVATQSHVPLGQPHLEGFQKLPQVSANDIKLLNTCKATHQAKVW
jgi:hypothetical protein